MKKRRDEDALGTNTSRDISGVNAEEETELRELK